MADSTGPLKWESYFPQPSKVDNKHHELFIAQLEKDFITSFKGEAWDVIFDKIYKLITIAVESNQLNQLLYRIDLGEKKAQECMDSSDPIAELAKAILLREAVKVIFRIQYSSNL